MHALAECVMVDEGEKEFLEASVDVYSPNVSRKRRLIEKLDLSSVKMRLCLPKDERGKGWSKELADTTEMWYKRFLVLCLVYGLEEIAPVTDEIDEFWHTHILDTVKYRHDCQLVFGEYLNHVPCNPESSPKVLEMMARSVDKTLKAFAALYGQTPLGEISGACCSNEGKCACCGNK